MPQKVSPPLAMGLAVILTQLFFVRPCPAYVVDRTVATVNDDVILESDVDKFVKKVKSKSFQELFGGIDKTALKNREAVLELLIEEKLINQQVKKLELQASDQEVDGQIRAIEGRNGISDDQLKERLGQLGTTMSEYRDGIRRQIERRNLIEREIKPLMEVSDDQLRHYYLRHMRPEDQENQYQIAQILIDKRPKGGVSAEARAKKIYNEVSKAPTDWDKYVRDFSDDDTTSTTGGGLGWFSPSSLSKEFRNVVPQTAPGGITPPVKTEAGYHIIKVIDTRKSDFDALPKERKEALRNQMIEEELQEKMAMWLERKKRESYITRFADGKNETKR